MVDPRPLPEPDDAATLVLERYLGAFGPASKRDVAAWAGVAQRDFADRLGAARHGSVPRRERGVDLLDLPDQPLPPASTKLPVRFLSRWDQVLLAYADRDRIIPPELGPLRLTLSGDQTVTVDGRVAASWTLERATRRVKVVIEPHVEIRRSALRHDRVRRRHARR